MNKRAQDRLSSPLARWLPFHVRGETKPVPAPAAEQDSQPEQMECGALFLICSPGTGAETELKCPLWWMKATAEKVPE